MPVPASKPTPLLLVLSQAQSLPFLFSRSPPAPRSQLAFGFLLTETGPRALHRPATWLRALCRTHPSDLANPKTNWNKTPGYTEAETSSFARVLNATGEDADAGKFVDIWRKRHPDLRHYTYFSYRFNCREKGLGWRLDMFVVSERLEERVSMCEIRSEIYGASDHCPVVLELAGAL